MRLAWRRGAVSSALVVALALAACGGQQATPGAPSASGTAKEQWDPASWKTDIKVSLPKVTDAENEEWRLKWLAGNAPKDVPLPPPPPVVRWSKSHSEYTANVARCMREAGFEVTADFDGRSLSYQSPEAQKAAMDLAFYNCDAKFPPDRRFFRDLNEDQLRVQYDYWDQYMIPCLKAQGYPVDVSNKPSREAWVAAFFTENRIDWKPNGFLNVPQDKKAAVARICPPFPPDKYMYPE